MRRITPHNRGNFPSRSPSHSFNPLRVAAYQREIARGITFNLGRVPACNSIHCRALDKRSVDGTFPSCLICSILCVKFTRYVSAKGNEQERETSKHIKFLCRSSSSVIDRVTRLQLLLKAMSAITFDRIENMKFLNDI